MKKNLKSTYFKYEFSISRSEEKLLKLSKEDPKKFESIIETGTNIISYSKNEDIDSLNSIIEANKSNLGYFSSFIKEGFLSALSFKYYEVIQFFLENGLNLNQDGFSDSLLVLIRISKFLGDDLPIELFELLLIYGIDVNMVDTNTYRTPIHLVCRYGQLQFVNLLLKNGNCDVNSVDGKGKTPLKYVEEKMNKGRNYKIIYDILKENGAKLTWKNEQIDN